MKPLPKAMQKVRYEVDPYNRLVVSGAGARNDLPKFRKVLDGRFEIDELNNLSYHIKSPLSESEVIPHQIRLKGAWSLTDERQLCLTLEKSGRQTFGDRITLGGEILDVDKGTLLFAVTTKRGDSIASTTYVLNIAGSWKADENNRLSFHVRKESGAYDILQFNGAWQVNKDHHIVYQYERKRLLRKKLKTHTLVFKGHWDIKDAFRISYLVSGSSDSTFNFTTSAGIFKEDYIKYELGLGAASDPDRRTVVITLFGEWKLRKDAGLVFEVKYGPAGLRAITFGADARLTDNDTVTFSLRDGAENKDMGIMLELSHKILEGDGEVFTRLLKSRQESALYAGAAWRW